MNDSSPTTDSSASNPFRWRPVRGGLINLYRYDSQEFRYEEGRLVLRGNNGTGKSRVLALQLPFLLDGEILPQRVEPDGDPAKRMDWNLLMGGKYDDRTGYTWIEFGRTDESGEEHFQTLGCGLRAVQGRGIAQQWLFITRQRIGHDLFLLNEHSQPLGKSRLEELVGAHGQVFGSGRVEEDRREYRKAVDALFFRLGPRYESLLSLLIQLRQPQLTRKLDEGTLSDALNQSLPPLPEAVLGDVADAFRTLENDRHELEDLIAARDGAEVFLVEYQRYIRIAARRRAEDVRKANSAYENTMRQLRDHEAKRQDEIEALAELERHLESLHRERTAADTHVQTLQDSPAMKSARELATARESAGKAEKRAEDAAHALHDSETAVAREREHHAAVEADDRHALAAIAGHRATSETHAGACDLLDHHRDHFRRDDASIGAGEAAMKHLIATRLDAVRHIEERNRKIEEERQNVVLARSAHDHAHTDFEESLDQEKKAIAAREEAVAALFQSYREWSADLVELAAPALDDIEEDFLLWCETADGDSPLAAAVKRAEQTANLHLAKLHGDIARHLDDTRAILSDREKEALRLRDGGEQAPPVPHTRDADARADRPGAPLWTVCDFRPDVSDPEKTALEAALEAAGLLDAWITPDGEIQHPLHHDTLLLPRTSPPASDGRSLETLLQPDPRRAAPVSDAVISTVLRHIGCAEGEGIAWVDRAGRWQLGPLHGSWSKPAAQYIGHASREAERQRRLRQIEAEIGEIQTHLAALLDDLSTAEARQRAARGEAAAAPTDGNVRGRLADIAAAHRTVDAKRTRLTETEAHLQAARKLHHDAVALRDEEAADLAIATWVERLSELRDRLAAYRESLTALKSAAEARDATLRQLERAAETLDHALRRHAANDLRHREAAEEAVAARTHAQTLEATVGASVEDILIQLEAAKLAAKEIGLTLDERSQQRIETQTAIAVLNSKIDDTNSTLDERSQSRNTAVSMLTGFADTGQLRVAHPELATVAAGAWSATRGVEIARQIEALLSEVEHDDAAWKRNQSEIHQHFETLQTSLRSHGYLPEGTLQNDIYVVSIPFQNKSCTIDELHDALIEIIRDRQELLNAREREVLENYLIDEVAESLHDLLHNALRWKEEANRELESRPMDTGMTLRFYWEPAPDSPPALVEARKLLLGARSTWSPAERKAVGEFLQQQIQTVRAANDTGTWQDHLTLAFDYRKWHQFGVERRQDGVWKRLTKRTHGTGSGGEKAVALTVPQLAAAAAHYRSAHALAPRLILLDEAFVGVDADMREKCFGMIAAFDLDVAITSENEWACYPTVPSIAIYQLSARPGIDAVHASRWVWNGRARTRDDTPPPPAIPPAPEP